MDSDNHDMMRPIQAEPSRLRRRQQLLFVSLR